MGTEINRLRTNGMFRREAEDIHKRKMKWYADQLCCSVGNVRSIIKHTHESILSDLHNKWVELNG